MYSTLPGFEVQISKGKLIFDALSNDMIKNTLDVRTTYLPADFAIGKDDTSLSFTVSAGPRVKLKVIPDLSGFGSMGKSFQRSLDKEGHSTRKNMMGSPLAFGAHFVSHSRAFAILSPNTSLQQPVRYDTIITRVPANHSKCDPGFPGGYMYEV